MDSSHLRAESLSYAPSPGPSGEKDQLTTANQDAKMKIWDDTFGWFRPQTLRWICFGLHAFLLGIHVILLGIWSRHYEHRVVVPVNKSTRVSTAVIVILQIILTGYTGILVVITQSLALRRTLLTRQTLTATHDVSGAWAGFGPALLSLYRQTSLAAAVFATFCISSYLASIAALHVTTPSIFSLQVFNQSNVDSTVTNLAAPVFDFSDGQVQYPFLFWSDRAELLPFLSRADPSLTVGLYDGTLYDVVKGDDNGRLDITVGAIGFDIQCGTLPNLRSVANFATPGDLFPKNWTIIWTLNSVDYNFTMLPIAGNVFQGAPVDAFYLGRHNIFISTNNFTDSKGDVGSNVVLDPPMEAWPGGIPIDRIQVFGCTMGYVNQTATVGAVSKLLTSVSPSTIKTDAEWKPFQPILSDETARWKWVKDPFLDSWIESWNLASYSTTQTRANASCVSDLSCYASLNEQYVMKDLNLLPDLWGYESYQTRPLFRLHQLENSLAKATAAIYWAAGHISDSYYHPTHDDSGIGGVRLVQGTASISRIATRFNLNTTPLVAGTVFSAAMLILAMIMVPQPSDMGVALDNLGVLQLVWLLRRHPLLQDCVANVPDPSINKLRAAGMKEARIADIYDERDHGL